MRRDHIKPGKTVKVIFSAKASERSMSSSTRLGNQTDETKCGFSIIVFQEDFDNGTLTKETANNSIAIK